MSVSQQLINEGKFKEAFLNLLKNYFENGHYRSNLTQETATKHVFTITALIQNNRIKSLFMDRTSRDEIKSIAGVDSNVIGAYYQFGKWLHEKQPETIVQALSENFVEGVLNQIRHRVTETNTRVSGIQTQVAELVRQQQDLQQTVQTGQTEFREFRDSSVSQNREVLDALRSIQNQVAQQHIEMTNFRAEMGQFRQETKNNFRKVAAFSKKRNDFYKSDKSDR